MLTKSYRIKQSRYSCEWLFTFCVDTTACPHGKVITLAKFGAFREEEYCVPYVVVPFSLH